MIILKNSDIQSVGIEKACIFSVQASDVLPGEYSSITIPDEYLGYSIYLCNCNGWSGVMFSNQEANVIRVKNTDVSTHSTIVNVLGIK